MAEPEILSIPTGDNPSVPGWCEHHTDQAADARDKDSIEGGALLLHARSGHTYKFGRRSRSELPCNALELKRAV